MAYTVKIRNQRNEMLQLYPSEDYMLMGITGITPSDGVISTTEMATQDGARFNASHVQSRNVVVTFDIRGEDEIVRQRRINLYRYIKTKEPVRVYISNDQRSVFIDGYVEKLDDAGSIFSKRERFQLSVICPDPFFRDESTDETSISFSSIGGMFVFPFHIVEPIPFSVRAETYQKTITNAGDTSCGMILRVTAHGAVTNPLFYNETSGETMQFEIGLVSGDELEISTVQGQKKARLRRNGQELNVINTMAHSSKWVSLEPGDNVFYYNADSGANNMSLNFIYTILYEGI